MKETVIILSIDEAKKVLAAWYANVAKSDPKEIAERILNGSLNDLIPYTIKYWNKEKIAKIFSDLNLGEPFVCLEYKNNQVLADQVLVRLNDELSYVVWELGNINPNDKQKLITNFDIEKYKFILEFLEEKNEQIPLSFNEIAQNWHVSRKIKYCKNKDSNNH